MFEINQLVRAKRSWDANSPSGKRLGFAVEEGDTLKIAKIRGSMVESVLHLNSGLEVYLYVSVLNADKNSHIKPL